MSPPKPRPARLPRAPRGLGPRGRAFWRAAWERFEFAAHEAALLTEACRQLDLVEALQAAVDERGTMIVNRYGAPVVNPAVGALRAARAELRAQLASLNWPEECEVAGGRHVAASKAARHRWLAVVGGGEAER
jgi:hypothetical protein